MRIHSGTASQALHKVGIAIQPSGKTRRISDSAMASISGPVSRQELPLASREPDLGEQQLHEITAHESFTFGGLQLLDFDQAYLVNKAQPEQAQRLDPALIKESHLLTALSRLGPEIDLDKALQVQQQAASILQKIRVQTIPEQVPVAAESDLLMVIEGAFGKIELDLEKLNPERLQALFATGLAQSSSEQMQASHSQMADLSQQIRSQMRLPVANEQAQNWIDLSMQPDFELPTFLQAALGYNPLDQAQSLSHFFSPTHQSIQSDQSGGSGPLDHLSAETLALQQRLAEQVAALVAEANALEDVLELAPQPNSPDVMDLLRSFLTIFKQLDLELKALLKPQLEQQAFARHLLAQFAEQLQGRLQVTADFVTALQAQPTERLRLLVNHQRQDLAGRLNLLIQSANSPVQEQDLQSSRDLLLA